MNFSNIKTRIRAVVRTLSNIQAFKRAQPLEQIEVELEEVNDEMSEKEAVINDYMEMCGYTEEEACAAYANMKDEEYA